MKPWNERKRTAFEILPEAQQKLASISGISIFPVMPPALPGGGIVPRGDRDRLDRRAGAHPGVREDPPAEGRREQQLLLPADHRHEDRPAPDRDRHRSRQGRRLGPLSLEQVGADVSTAVGGNFVNRFNIEGRSYKVIPQVERTARLTPDQLQQIYVTGPDGGLGPLSARSRRSKNSTQPRSLNRFQQLNSVKLSGATGLPLDQALKFLEDEAAKILPEGYKIDYTGESRQLRTEGNKFLPAFALALVLIFLVLAAQFNSFRDPFVILAGSVPLAMFGALLMTFLKTPGEHHLPGWTTTLNIYSQVGLVTLVGLISKNGILVVEFANELQRTGLSKLEAIQQAGRIRLRPVLDDDRRDRGRTLPARARHRRRRHRA